MSSKLDHWPKEEIFCSGYGQAGEDFGSCQKNDHPVGQKTGIGSRESAGAGEIAIRVTGLRPGEKMFEELSYSDNLTGTAHPRIMTTDDSSLSGEGLKALLHTTIDAIAVDDHQKLFKIIRQVCNGVASDKT